MSNDFKLFSGGGGANALTPTAYAALTTLIANGFQTGTASSQQVNTVLRQATAAAAMLGQVISDAGLNAVDDGTVATLETAFKAALKTFLLSSQVGAWIADAAGNNRLFFDAAGQTTIRGFHGSYPILLVGATGVGLTVRNNGAVASDADATSPSDLVRYSQFTAKVKGTTWATVSVTNGTWITNSSGHPIEVFVTSNMGNASTGWGYVAAKTTDLDWGNVIGISNDAASIGSFSFTVPAGKQWAISWSGIVNSIAVSTLS